jgi:hypothetical protein
MSEREVREFSFSTKGGACAEILTALAPDEHQVRWTGLL